jgi:hypothetical protein
MPPVSTYTPARELAARVISLLRADPVLNGAAPTGVAGYVGGLLFPDFAPRVNGDDDRVYTSSATLPPDVNVRGALPRILVEAKMHPHQYEQEPDVLTGAITLWIHLVVPDDQEEYGDRIAAYVVQLLVSTQLSTNRILASGLYLTSDPEMKDRIAAFEGAWEYVFGFRSASGSSLQ